MRPFVASLGGGGSGALGAFLGLGGTFGGDAVGVGLGSGLTFVCGSVSLSSSAASGRGGGLVRIVGLGVSGLLG
jgi:hypothetical protein